MMAVKYDFNPQETAMSPLCTLYCVLREGKSRFDNPNTAMKMPVYEKPVLDMDKLINEGIGNQGIKTDKPG